jgi:CRP/FNR family transcriptional regulator, cyclic AMP receptor protein
VPPPVGAPAEGPVAATFSARLSEAERAQLLALGGTERYPEGSALMIQGEYDERVMLLLAGRVKVTRTAGGDHELLLAIRDAGDVLGELAFIDGMPRVASVTALEPAEALVMAARVFRAHLQTAPTVAVVLLESVSARFRESTVKRLQFAASDTLGRLASRIVELADRYGEAIDGGVAVAMPISQDELASWTGASRAGVAQGLQTLRELGWLSTERRRIVLHDPPALRDRAA